MIAWLPVAVIVGAILILVIVINALFPAHKSVVIEPSERALAEAVKKAQDEANEQQRRAELVVREMTPAERIARARELATKGKE